MPKGQTTKVKDIINTANVETTAAPVAQVVSFTAIRNKLSHIIWLQNLLFENVKKDEMFKNDATPFALMRRVSPQLADGTYAQDTTDIRTIADDDARHAYGYFKQVFIQHSQLMKTQKLLAFQILKGEIADATAEDFKEAKEISDRIKAAEARRAGLGSLSF